MRRVHWSLLALCLFGIGVNQAWAADEVEPSPANAAEAPTTTRTTPVLKTRVNPKYPPRALERGGEGLVELEFFIGPKGKVSNIEPIRSTPVGHFERAAIRAVGKWRYKPIVRNGTSVRQSQQVVLSFRLENRMPSIHFQLTYPSALKAVKEGQFELASKKLLELEKSLIGSLLAKELLNALYAEYYIGLNKQLLALHHIRETNFYADYPKYKGEKVNRLAMIFDLENSEGHYAAALNTYESLIRHGANISPDVHNSASAIRTTLETHTPLAANGLLRGRCYKCGEGVSMWSHRLSYNSFHLADIEGKLTSLKLACDYHWETYAKIPETMISIPPEWGKCQVRVKGKTGTTFTLVED